MSNNLKAKHVRLNPYSPLELSAIINKEDSYGLDKEMLECVLKRTLDYPYSFELCTIYGVYKIDNYLEPLFFVEACGLNSDNIIEINLLANKSRSIELSIEEVNEAINLLKKYIKEFDVSKIIINEDNEIYPLIKIKKRKNSVNKIEYKNNAFAFRLISSFISPFVLFAYSILFFLIAFFNDFIYGLPEIFRIISYVIGIIFVIFNVIVIFAIAFFPLLHMIKLFISKKIRLKKLMVLFDVISFILNCFVFYYLFS